jgi:Concanavalin A-like lectin/glucanases superfamily
MSASLVVLLPIILLATVGLLCFVGCGLDVAGMALPAFTQYSDTTVLANSAVVAYWPLGESADNVPAIDRAPHPANGQYIDQVTLPAIYPWPAYSVANTPNPDVQSAAAPGSIAFAQPGIVAGDAIQPANDPTQVTPCLVVNGCYVNVPFKSKINPPTSFTVEAWVRVDWQMNDENAWRFVLDARDFDPCKGFAILARADDNQPDVYHWQAIIGNGGNGTAGFSTATSDDPAITLNDPSLPSGITYYLAATYDGPSQTLILYVDGEQRGPKVNPVTYVPNTAQPLWIGAGAPYVPLRPQPPGVVASPLFPFNGAIQDVAIYKAALASDVILLHYHNGNAVDP